MNFFLYVFFYSFFFENMFFVLKIYFGLLPGDWMVISQNPMDEVRSSVDYILSNNNVDVSRLELQDMQDLTLLLSSILCPSDAPFDTFGQRFSVIFKDIGSLNTRFKAISSLIVNLHAKLITMSDHEDLVKSLESCNQALFSARESMIFTYRVMSIGRPDLKAMLPTTRMEEFYTGTSSHHTHNQSIDVLTFDLSLFIRPVVRGSQESPEVDQVLPRTVSNSQLSKTKQHPLQTPDDGQPLYLPLSTLQRDQRVLLQLHLPV